MAEPQTLHIFRDGQSDRFGFTEDRTGANVPTQLALQGWKLLDTIRIVPGEGARAGMNIEDIQAEIRARGYCVKKNVISIQFRQDMLVLRSPLSDLRAR